MTWPGRGSAALFVQNGGSFTTVARGLLLGAAAYGLSGCFSLLTQSDDLAGQGGGGPNSAYEQAVLADGPLGYWKLDDTSLQTAVDSSGNHRDGAYAGGVALGAAGRVGAAVEFNGSDAAISVPYDVELEGTGDLTLEAWVLPKTLGPPNQYNFVMGKYVGSNEGGYELDVVSGGAALFTLRGGNMSSDASAGPVPIGRWTHLVAVHDTTHELQQVYVNGERLKSTPTTLVVGSTMIDFFIGRRDPQTAWTGALDEVAIYGTAVPESRIREHYMAAGPEP